MSICLFVSLSVCPQAVSFSKLVKPNKFFQFSFLDFLYLQNQSFPNIADIQSIKSNYFKCFKNQKAQKQIVVKKKNCSKYTKYLKIFIEKWLFFFKNFLFFIEKWLFFLKSGIYSLKNGCLSLKNCSSNLDELLKL